ncbi:MAG: sigma-54 dependent transcriptional regulator [Syntrophobacterales bacterium]|nr:sigma-54 dependent transcriptional regulator [Syntrophobacterales bacterium]
MGQVIADTVRTFIEAVPDPVICYDTSCHIIATNSKGREEILKTFNDVRHIKGCEIFGDYSSSRSCSSCVYEKVKHGCHDYNVEGEVALPDGQRKLFSRRISLWQLNDGKILVEIWKDLSREHILSREVENKNLIIDGFLELFDIPVFITDAHFRLVGLNRFLEKFVKIPFSHLLGRSLWDVIQLGEQDTHGLAKTGQRVLLRARLSRHPEEECNVRFYSVGHNGKVIGHVGFILKKWQSGIPTRYPHYEMEYFFEICREASHKETLREYISFVEKLAKERFPVPFDISITLFDEDRKSFIWVDFEEGSNHLQQQLKTFLAGSEKFTLFQASLHGAESQMRLAHSGDPSFLPSLIIPFATNYPEWFGFPIATHRRVLGYFFMGFSDIVPQLREGMYFFYGFMTQMAGHIRQLVLREQTERKIVSEQPAPDRFGRLIGRSEKMQAVYELIELVAPSEATVLITGENGTGKELVALEIHHRSPRATGPFVVAHCSAYSPTLLESELFGHERGAFTGAIKQKKGRIERAQGGTLFLDEIGDIAPATQVLLLRFLQDKRFERVGGEKTLEADVRIIAATNRDLYEEVQNGRFRDDLFYRLNVISIHLPPLRERKEDIPLLVRHFLEKYSEREKKPVNSIAPDAMKLLLEYDWPGNVRQLENAISHAVVLVQPEETITASHLPGFLKNQKISDDQISLYEHEKMLIKKTLQECKGNKHEAAKKLRISRSTLYSKLRKYGLAS